MKRLILLVLVLTYAPSAALKADSNLASHEQKAFDEAVRSVADSVVKIRTIGGLDRVGKTLISSGPTTGLIVSADGYIVSSAFNFAGKPSSILVRLANGEQLAAELVGRDTNRMLVLLKVNTERALPVPNATSKSEVRVGQWAVAVGRTFQTDQVDISIGIVSALQRMYGRVLQTDANVSVANYGGPLVDISGKVLGVLVPMSPQPSSGENAELAGANFYDSGIGFAVPFEHVLGILERWQEQSDLLPGKLGIGMQQGDAHTTPPKIVSVWRESPAATVGWQADDLITAVDGTEVATQAQLRFQITPRYAGDTIQVTLDRDGETIKSKVKLADQLAPYRHAFCGVLPDRMASSGESSGVGVRLVWPGSPADAAGLKSGDTITKLDDTAIAKPADLRKQLLAMHPQQKIVATVQRGSETLTLELELSTLPTDVLTAADLVSYYEALPVVAENQAQIEKLQVPEFEQEASYYSPTLAAGQQPGLLLWLGDGDLQRNQAIFDDWRDRCDRDGLALLIAPPKQDSSWATSDLDYLQQLMRLAVRNLSVDKRRLVVLGQGKAGQLAYALALAGRSGFAGVVSIDAPLPRALKLRKASPNNRLAVLMVESQDAGFAPLMRRDLALLLEAGYPTIKLQQAPGAVDELEVSTRSSIQRWMLGLECL